MRMLWCCLLGVGCISPTISLDNENGPDSDTSTLVDSGQSNDTGDSSNETLDLELSTEVYDGHGTNGMDEWHLIFDGELALQREFEVDNNEFNQFLKPDTPWGFAVTIAPYNEDVDKFLFGEGASNGEQLSLIHI